MERHTHSLHTRLAHWINALFVLTLLVTGFSMFGAQHHIGWLSLDFSRHDRFTLHVIAGALFALNGTIYGYEILGRGGWRRLLHGLPKHFGPLSYELPQRGAYLAVFAGAGVMILTGAALWFKHQAPWLIHALGGPHVALTIHLASAFALLAFIFAHVVQIARAGWPTLRSMIGYISERSLLLR